MTAEKVLETLLRQVDAFRAADWPYNGRLEYFRKAIAMEHFGQVAEWLESTIECALFSSIRDIELMEEGYRKRDRIELVVQCCLVVEWSAFQGVQPRNALDIRESWLFEDVRSLEDIAYLSHRLRFVHYAGELRQSINRGLISSVEKCFRDASVTWQGLLLISAAVPTECTHTMFSELLDTLENTSLDLPKAAATLLLSFVSNAIHCTERKVCSNGENVVRKLLLRGASLMVSKDGHSVLLERIVQHLPTIRGPWWLESVEIVRCAADEPSPTALNRLLRHHLRPEFKTFLSQHVCCSLDSSTRSIEHFPTKIISLKCLAARHVKESDADDLPPVLRFFTVKHRPLPLEPCDLR